MTAPTLSAADATALFDLITPFGEAGDAKLRGNATYAYAALARLGDADVRTKALDELLRVIGADTGAASGGDWERRFAPRALEAVRQLDPEDRRCVGQRLLEEIGRAAPARRRAMARFFLEANQPPADLLALHWARFAGLTWRAGRPGFWQSVWAAVWRAAVAWSVIGAGLLSLKHPPNMFLAAGLCLGATVLLAVASIAGRVVPPRAVWRIDTATGALVFALLAALAAHLMPDTHARSGTLAASLVGLALGTVFRARHWRSVLRGDEHSNLSSALRPLAFMSLATLGCMALGYLGIGAEIVGGVWVVVGPAAFLSGLLDIWLESVEPQPMQPRARGSSDLTTRYALAALLITGTSVLLFGNLKATVSPPATASRSMAVPPASAASSTSFAMPLATTVPIEVAEPGDYMLDAAGMALTLRLQDGSELPTRPGSGGEVETHLDKGRYLACLSPAFLDWCAGPERLADMHFDSMAAIGSVFVTRPGWSRETQQLLVQAKAKHVVPD